MARIADVARINGVVLSGRYIPITLNKVNKGSASFLARRIREGVNKGVMKYQIRVAKDAPCYPNYITPVAGVISHYKRLGVVFLSSNYHGCTQGCYFW